MVWKQNGAAQLDRPVKLPVAAAYRYLMNSIS